MQPFLSVIRTENRLLLVSASARIMTEKRSSGFNPFQTGNEMRRKKFAKNSPPFIFALVRVPCLHILPGSKETQHTLHFVASCTAILTKLVIAKG